MAEPPVHPSHDEGVEKYQLERWTRLGQLFDSSPEVDFSALAEVLAGERSYDELGDAEGELVRAVWERRIARGIAELDFEAELQRSGWPYYSADAQGNVIEHRPGKAPRPLPAPAD